MTVRAVVLPATPLLVPGAAGGAHLLAATRAAVLDALAGPHRGRDPRWGVLAPAARTRTGARRASLAGAGIADRWVPSLPTADEGPAAGTSASVALWALAAAVGEAAVRSAVVVELAARSEEPSSTVGGPDVRTAVDLLAGLDVLVVAGGVPGRPDAGTAGLAPPLDAVLAALADRGGWSRDVTHVAETGGHLAATYDVEVWRDAQDTVNQPTPASSRANRAVRPTSSTAT